MSSLLGLEEEKNYGDVESPDIEPDPTLTAQLKSGANWLYWIGGLSVVNSLIFTFGGNLSFIAGLGFTQLVDAVIEVSIQSGGPTSLKAIAIIFDLILALIFSLLGYYANKRFSAAFVIGIVIYVFDALLLLLIGSYLSAGFHAFALFFIVRGFMACRTLGSIAPTRRAEPPQP